MRKKTHLTNALYPMLPNYNAEQNIFLIPENNQSFWREMEFLQCVFEGFWLTYLPVDGSPGGRDPGLRTGELVGLQSSGNGLGMAGRDDVLSCCSSTCNLLHNGNRETGQRKSQFGDGLVPSCAGKNIKNIDMQFQVMTLDFSLRLWPRTVLKSEIELWNETCWHIGNICRKTELINKAFLYSTQAHVCFCLIYP